MYIWNVILRTLTSLDNGFADLHGRISRLGMFAPGGCNGITRLHSLCLPMPNSAMLDLRQCITCTTRVPKSCSTNCPQILRMEGIYIVACPFILTFNVAPGGALPISRLNGSQESSLQSKNSTT